MWQHRPVSACCLHFEAFRADQSAYWKKHSRSCFKILRSRCILQVWFEFRVKSVHGPASYALKSLDGLWSLIKQHFGFHPADFRFSLFFHTSLSISCTVEGESFACQHRGSSRHWTRSHRTSDQNLWHCTVMPSLWSHSPSNTWISLDARPACSVA